MPSVPLLLGALEPMLGAAVRLQTLLLTGGSLNRLKGDLCAVLAVIVAAKCPRLQLLDVSGHQVSRHTAVTLRLHCCYSAVTVRLQCGYIAVTVRLYTGDTAITSRLQLVDVSYHQAGGPLQCGYSTVTPRFQAGDSMVEAAAPLLCGATAPRAVLLHGNQLTTQGLERLGYVLGGDGSETPASHVELLVLTQKDARFALNGELALKRPKDIAAKRVISAVEKVQHVIGVLPPRTRCNRCNRCNRCSCL